MDKQIDEKWKNISNYEGLYQISSFGRVKSLKCGRQKILKLGSNPLGYSIIGLWKDKKQKFFPVHRIVATTFISNPKNKPEVNHIDGNKKNNNIDNLEWVTKSENMKHAIRTGLLVIKRSIQIPKQIEQLDLENNLIKTWDNCKEIVEQLKVADSHIYKCCTNKAKTAYGYKWRYKKESVNNLQRAN